jgi:DNA-binding NarL/FixJ family response regulator
MNSVLVRILIIDSEPRWIEFAKRDLGVFEIVVAKTEEEAIAQLDEDQFDLVIASAASLEILKVISEKYSEKKVVVTTVQPSTQEALQAYRMGAIRYFPKSFSQQDLLNNVKEVLPKKS